MDEQVLKGNWKQLKGKVKQYWGQLTNDELTQIGGRMDRLTGKLQEKYGYTRQEAREEVRKFMDKVENSGIAKKS